MSIEQENKEHVIKIKTQLADKQLAYLHVFSGEDAKVVLDDLAKRCFEHSTTINEKPIIMAFNEGRRSVYKYIVNILRKDLESLQDDLTKGEEQ